MSTSTDIDLITLIEHDLGQGHKSGRWMRFHCPFPGHKHGDRNPSLAVSNGDGNRGPVWKCFACGLQGDPAKWVMEYRHVSYPDALRYLQIPVTPAADRRRLEPPVQQPDHPPGETWQARALQLVQRAELCLWSDQGAEALAWLHARGLKNDTIRAARLGYIPRRFEEPAGRWGTPNDDPRPIYLYQSILIPGIVAGKAWYLKMRTIKPKDFPQVRGSRSSALYLADHIQADRPLVICEGEFDALLLQQEIGDLASVVTLGGSQNPLNLTTWGLYLLRPSSIIRAYDMDQSGTRADQKLAWIHNSQRLKIPQLREGDKDITDFHKSGGHLRSLIENALDPETPVRVTWSTDTRPAAIPGQYSRNPDGSLEAFYTREQLDDCLGSMHAQPIDEVPI
jgi:DNA primase